jgi:CHAP domain/Putative peptidoglycan binding domain
MTFLLAKGDQRAEVVELQTLLASRGYPVVANGSFDTPTFNAVRAFQAQNLDQHGQPLVVDGKVGDLSWWSLNHPKPTVTAPSAVDYSMMPPDASGGSMLGRAALQSAIGELRAGAVEVGGNNSGPWVKKYLDPAHVAEGNSWCASFVSWCFLQASGGDQATMPFPYSPGAKALLKEFKDEGWEQEPQSGYVPLPGDIVVWWRVQAQGWQGHVGLVHQLKDGMLYTIEGNRSPQVQGFSYVFSRMDKLLGFGHVP